MSPKAMVRCTISLALVAQMILSMGSPIRWARRPPIALPNALEINTDDMISGYVSYLPSWDDVADRTAYEDRS